MHARRFLPLAILLLDASLVAAAPPRQRGSQEAVVPERCRDMMADMKAMDARLEKQLSTMNAAEGNAKVEAMAALLNELVSERKTMHEERGGMSVTNCPMMQ